MELIELKSAWELLQEDIVNKDIVEKETIERSIHSKSRSEISKIKRWLHVKFVIASLSLVGAVGLAIVSVVNKTVNPLEFIFSPAESVIFYLIMAVAISVMAYFNYQAYSQIQAVQFSSYNLKENLACFIDAMKKAIAFNIYSDAFITPVILTWVYYAYAFRTHHPGFDLRTALLVILPVLIGFLSYFLQRFMQHLKFGRYLSRLGGYLESLQKNQKKV